MFQSWAMYLILRMNEWALIDLPWHLRTKSLSPPTMSKRLRSICAKRRAEAVSKVFKLEAIVSEKQRISENIKMIKSYFELFI